MKTFLRPGESVWLELAGEPCEIRELLGVGRQGEVYRASWKNRDVALKWYSPEHATPARRTEIAHLIKTGAPSESFLWPFDLTGAKERPGLGYVMPLRDARFRSMSELLRRKIDPTFGILLAAALGFADAFLRLHTRGFCYTRFSFAHFFFDPLTGEIALSKNDNLAIDGEKWNGDLGGPRFLAPELFGEKSEPNVATDLHSLAVFLFYLLMAHHPLEGQLETEIDCLDLRTMRKLYGDSPLFIFDPKNLANRPVRGLQDNALTFWNFYPGYVRDIFLRAFTVGLYDPDARVGENEWRSVLTRMRDQIYYCDNCGSESFLSDSGNSPGALPDHECWYCRQTLPPPLRMRLAHHAVVLNQDTVLFAHHLDGNRRNDFSQIMAEINPHPTRPDVWGLKNVSALTWNSLSPAGASVVVPSGRSVSLVPGLRIRFGNVEGTVL